MIAAPRRIKARSRTGRAKAGHAFKLLRINGYEPFAASDAAYAQERVDGVDVRLTTDLRGVPISRAMVDGELQDVTWWRGPASDACCTGCTIADGRVRAIARTTRAARVRDDNRVPELKTAGHWHPDCFKSRMAGRGWGHDVKQHAGSKSGAAMQERPSEHVTQDIRTSIRTDAPPVTDPNAELRMAWVRFTARRRAYLKGMGGFK